MVKLDRLIQLVEKSIMMLAFTVMVVVTFAQVLARFVFNNPISWSEEVARYLFVWITLMGAAHSVVFAKHFMVDFLVVRLPEGMQKCAAWLSLFCLLLFGVLMMWYGMRVTLFTQNQTSPALLLPMSYPYFCIPLSGAFIVFHVLRIFLSGKETLVAVAADESTRMLEGGFAE